MNVTVYGSLRGVTGAKAVELDATPESVGEALEAFLEAYPGAESQLLGSDGEIRPSVRVMVDGERVGLEAACPPDAEIQLFPAMQGGHKNHSY